MLSKLVVSAGLLLMTSSMVYAQEEEPKTEALVSDIDNGYMVAVETKLTTVNDRFANFLGVYGGWVIGHKFLLGAGGYGKTTGIHEIQMGYGGLVLEYYVNPNRLVNFSVKGLIGGGSASWRWDDPFFVAEPEGKVILNITDWFRLGGGAGYRFVRGSYCNSKLSGFTANIQLMFGTF
jgi:hypothetical protein